MEIHPPHAAARSLKDFFLQLLTITVGVLIALSIEGIVEWRHHRMLVRDAKAMIALEISDNRKDSTASWPAWPRGTGTSAPPSGLPTI